jgi:hypothetical protein
VVAEVEGRAAGGRGQHEPPRRERVAHDERRDGEQRAEQERAGAGGAVRQAPLPAAPHEQRQRAAPREQVHVAAHEAAQAQRQAAQDPARRGVAAQRGGGGQHRAGQEEQRERALSSSPS